MEWRRTGAGWQRRVVRPVLEDGAWFVVEEWMPAELLEAKKRMIEHVRRRVSPRVPGGGAAGDAEPGNP
jgi:hypothetical protein